MIQSKTKKIERPLLMEYLPEVLAQGVILIICHNGEAIIHLVSDENEKILIIDNTNNKSKNNKQINLKTKREFILCFQIKTIKSKIKIKNKKNMETIIKFFKFTNHNLTNMILYRIN